MKLLKTVFAVTLFCLSQAACAQVSYVEGFTPMEGVVIFKAQPVQSVTPGAVFKDGDDCPEMVVIPAGSFMMGSPPDPEHEPFSNAKPMKLGDDFEKPQHLVTVQSFAMEVLKFLLCFLPIPLPSCFVFLLRCVPQ